MPIQSNLAPRSVHLKHLVGVNVSGAQAFTRGGASRPLAVIKVWSPKVAPVAMNSTVLARIANSVEIADAVNYEIEEGISSPNMHDRIIVKNSGVYSISAGFFCTSYAGFSIPYNFRLQLVVNGENRDYLCWSTQPESFETSLDDRPGVPGQAQYSDDLMSNGAGYFRHQWLGGSAIVQLSADDTVTIRLYGFTNIWSTSSPAIDWEYKGCTTIQRL